MNLKTKKYYFMGTPPIAAYLFEQMILEGYQICGLIAQPDSLKTKDGRLIPVPTKEVALKYGIPVYQPEKIKNDYASFIHKDCDVVICLSYGQIVPEEVLNWPKEGCLNIHGSLLPTLRGASPIQYALFQGLSTTGITLQKMALKMDAGEIIAQEVLSIDETDNFSSLEEKMKIMIPPFIFKVLPLYLNQKLPLITQNENEVTFASLIKKEHEKLDVNCTVNQFVNRVRGLSLNPGGYLYMEDGKKLKILKASSYSSSVIALPGTVNHCFKDLIILQVSDGEVRLYLLQEEGKKVLSAQDFANGHQKVVGQRWR